MRNPYLGLYKLVSTTPAEETMVPLDQSGCKVSHG